MSVHSVSNDTVKCPLKCQFRIKPIFLYLNVAYDACTQHIESTLFRPKKKGISFHCKDLVILSQAENERNINIGAVIAAIFVKNQY
jgi:hypothetical protein